MKVICLTLNGSVTYWSPTEICFSSEMAERCVVRLEDRGDNGSQNSCPARGKYQHREAVLAVQKITLLGG